MADASDKEKLIDAMAREVVFTGWSEKSLRAAAAKIDMSFETVAVLFPNGASDSAIAFHRLLDARFAASAESALPANLRQHEKIIWLVMQRISVMAPYKSAVQSAASFFILPAHCAKGNALIWETADLIWRLAGDSSDDLNWYSKRLILSSVYIATVLYWLDPSAPDESATEAFLTRRIKDVLKIEKTKAALRRLPFVPAAEGWLNNLARGCRTREGQRFWDMPASVGKQQT